MALQDAQDAVSAELDRLRKQLTQLEEALKHLDGKGQGRRHGKAMSTIRSAKTQRTASTNGRKRQPKRKRIPASERQEQILSIVKKRPGIGQGDLAKEAGVSTAYVYGIVKALEAEKKVERAHGGVLAR